MSDARAPLAVMGTPADRANPTAGPWLVDCSACGPIGIIDRPHVVDYMIVNHWNLHRANHMVGSGQ